MQLICYSCIDFINTNALLPGKLGFAKLQAMCICSCMWCFLTLRVIAMTAMADMTTTVPVSSTTLVVTSMSHTASSNSSHNLNYSKADEVTSLMMQYQSADADSVTTCRTQCERRCLRQLPLATELASWYAWSQATTYTLLATLPRSVVS